MVRRDCVCFLLNSTVIYVMWTPVVWYAPKGGDVDEERSRSAVWQVISSEQEFSQMDLRECVFLPEEHGWEIVRIQKKERNGLWL